MGQSFITLGRDAKQQRQPEKQETQPEKGPRGSLEGPIAKLARANLQRIELEKQVTAVWPPTKAWPVRSEEHRGGLEYRFYLGELAPVDPSWALSAGEIIFDLRCALDHLVYQLHVRRYGGRMVSQWERRSMFPIFDDETDFKRNGAWRIDKLSLRDQRTMKHLQPYVARNDAWYYVRQALGTLDTLHNVDKHRKLHVVTAAKQAVEIREFPPEYGFQQDLLPWGAMESRQHVETWTFGRVPPPEFRHHSGIYIQVALQTERGKFRGLLPLLESFVNNVAYALLRFRDRFPPTLIAGAPHPTLWLDRGGPIVLRH